MIAGINRYVLAGIAFVDVKASTIALAINTVRVAAIAREQKSKGLLTLILVRTGGISKARAIAMFLTITGKRSPSRELRALSPDMAIVGARLYHSISEAKYEPPIIHWFLSEPKRDRPVFCWRQT